MTVSSVAWLCACPTPFLIAQVKTLKKYIPNVDLVFFDDISKHPERLDHWNVDQGFTISPSAFKKNISKYQYVISGLPISRISTYSLLNLCRSYSTLILYNEIPFPVNNWILDLVKRNIYSILLRIIRPSAIFGIGAVASKYYSDISPQGVFVAPLPYFIEGCNYTTSTSPNKILAPSAKAFRFIFSGQLIKRNNLFTLIRAFKHLNDRNTSCIELVLYGSGPLEHELRLLIHDLSLDGKISIISDPPVSWSDRLEPLLNSDCLVSVPNYSGWGLTIPEALLFKRPVISTTSALSAHNYVVSGANGILLSKFTVGILASAMSEIIHNSAYYSFPEVILSEDSFAKLFLSLLSISGSNVHD